MIDMFPVDACMLEPPFQRRRVYEMPNMVAAELPCDADVEPEGKNLVELVSRSIFSADDGTARAIVVMVERKTTHEVTYGNRASAQKSTAFAGLRECGAQLRKEWICR